jgi:hypothetical protein
MNWIIFGTCIFNSFGVFITGFLFTGFYIFVTNFFFDMVARFVLKKYPQSIEMFNRIIRLLPAFYLLNILVVSGLFYLYRLLDMFPCKPRPDMLIWAILFGCCASTLVTFFNLGVANWEAWKLSVTETEKLRNSYQRSKILGLKGQINPHFLFNCFNTLSGLIADNEEKAEIFLDEMTKVHRYLLRSDDELMVTLEEEMRFADSYLYLAKERFGDAICSFINIEKSDLHKNIPPLSMQVILENIIYTNALSKTDPLTIHIRSANGIELMVLHSLHKKTVMQNLDVDDGLDNLINKYKMLKGGKIRINENENNRTMWLPLFNSKEATL